MIKNTLLTLFTASALTMAGCSSEGKTASKTVKPTTETVSFQGKVMNLRGAMVSVGDDAPKAVVVTKDLVEVTLGGKSKKTQIIVVVPSIDTPVCHLEARTFNEKVAARDDVEVTVVSMDLPFAAGRFCATEGIKAITMASDYRYNAVGSNYGVSIKGGLLGGILARAIFVVKNGKVVYKELVKEVTNEPDYEAALKAI